MWVAGPGAEGRDGGYMQNARNCLRCKNGKSKRGSKHLVCVGGCGQCRERLVSVSGAEEERRQLPPRLHCPPSLFCLCPPSYPPPPRPALHQISIGSKMVATHLDFTTTPTSFVNSTSRALAAGARSQSILRSTLDIRPGRIPAGWQEERELMRGVRQVLGPLLLPSLTCLQRLKHQPAALVVSLIWLLLACRLPGSCCRAGSSVVAAPARPPVRPVVIPPPHTLRYAAVRGRGSQGA